MSSPYVVVKNKYTPSYNNLNFSYGTKQAVYNSTMNMLDYFAPKFYEEVAKIGGLLVKIEASESPSRTYVYSFRGRDEYLNDIKEHTRVALGNIVHAIVEESLNED